MKNNPEVEMKNNPILEMKNNPEVEMISTSAKYEDTGKGCKEVLAKSRFDSSPNTPQVCVFSKQKETITFTLRFTHQWFWTVILIRMKQFVEGKGRQFRGEYVCVLILSNQSFNEDRQSLDREFRLAYDEDGPC